MVIKDKTTKTLNKLKLKNKKIELSLKNQVTNQIFKSPLMLFNVICITIIALVFLRNLYISAFSDIKSYIDNTDIDIKNVSIFKNIKEIDIFISSNSYNNNNNNNNKMTIYKFITFPKTSVVNIKSEKSRFINENNLLLKALIVIE